MTLLTLKPRLNSNRQYLSFYSNDSDPIRIVGIRTSNQNSEQVSSEQLDQSERLYFQNKARHCVAAGCALAQAGFRHNFSSCWDSTTPVTWSHLRRSGSVGLVQRPEPRRVHPEVARLRQLLVLLEMRRPVHQNNCNL
jgi:hypothetical protein